MATAKANVVDIGERQSVVKPLSRVCFSCGSKGGSGKSQTLSLIANWYQTNNIPVTLLDLDTENKSKGSLAAYYPAARKVNIHTSEGLDAFVDALDEGAPIVVADMGSGSGAVTANWFDLMYDQVAESGVVFTAVGVITPDVATVEGILAWGRALQHRVEWLIVRNAITDPADFNYWETSPAAIEFRRVFQPKEIAMEYRVPKVENPARKHGITIATVADRKAEIPELQQTTVVMRAQAYRRNLFAQLDGVKDLLTL